MQDSPAGKSGAPPSASRRAALPVRRRHSAGVVGADLIRAELERLAAEQAPGDVEPLSPRTLADRYPERDMPVAGALPAIAIEADEGDPVESEALRLARERYERFCDLREEMLGGYCYNTARAYWGDLDDVYLWAEERGKDVLSLRDEDLKQYAALLRRRKYSETTIRRRHGSLRMLYTKRTERND